MEFDLNKDVEMKNCCINSYYFNTSEITNVNTNQKHFSSINEKFVQYESTYDSYNKFENTRKKYNYKILRETKPISIMSSCEKRLINDINELTNNKNIGKNCEIIINEYKKIKDTNNFQLIIEFKNYFSIKFVFLPDYPFVPPLISFHSGIKSPLIFNSDGYIVLENTKKSNWTPIIWLSTLVNSIELLILKNLNNKNIYKSDTMFIPKLFKYGKRKWNDYLKDEKKIFKYDISIINELTKNLKEMKSLVI